MTGMTVERVPGSFRDPGSQVYRSGQRILRALRGDVAQAFQRFAASSFARAMEERGWLIGYQPVADVSGLPQADMWIEHPHLPVISHPYEWPFALLREAALFHLDVQLLALEHGFTLRDATAYNVQFDRGRPVFIDVPSFTEYREGAQWHGHRQFCEQFLHPLLLRARFGIAHHAWYRGAPDGIAASDLYELSGWRDWLSPRYFAHLLLPVKLQQRAGRHPATLTRSASRPMPRSALRAFIGSIRNWTGSLAPRGKARSSWVDYEHANTYSPAASLAKHRVIADFVTARQPSLVLDVGCNSGEYSAYALAAGAGQVVGIDSDVGALDAACERRTSAALALLPLFVDAANPSPGQGWRNREFPAFSERVRADAVMALAVVHHLALGRNIPLEEAITWVVGLAPTGVVEFVPKDDSTTQSMLQRKGDIFPDYDEKRFRASLEAVARVESLTRIPSSGRVLYQYAR
jgi:ribosomal protein L11 methylase PrmA